MLNVAVELDMDRGQLEALADVVHSDRDIAASVASGSFRTDGMIIAPCSMKTLASIATGVADTLVARAADVAFKERRRVVLLVRETPLHLVHLRNMTTVHRTRRYRVSACARLLCESRQHRRDGRPDGGPRARPLRRRLPAAQTLDGAKGSRGQHLGGYGRSAHRMAIGPKRALSRNSQLATFGRPIIVRNSLRVRGSERNCPSSWLVTMLTPCLRTPRVVMHW